MRQVLPSQSKVGSKLVWVDENYRKHANTGRRHYQKIMFHEIKIMSYFDKSGLLTQD